ncbi:uncharacterized protein LOC115995601 [Ipomoea triloba]|uniref:uncharacterized protein LOC115995601 n=1 Tax=Ipomoea triloba TaxID=35885 RepID=UPI00125DA23F|nr:uncharacterized protein LOC115995601 [Ipomoea triloba]
MGNCIVPQAKAKAKAIRVLEYKPPIKVLSEFKSHAIISDSPAKKKKKKVKFADEVEEVRIKVVISKQELKSMVMSGEGISLSDIVCHQINTSESLVDDDDEVFSKGWEPMLHSIPEIDYAA